VYLDFGMMSEAPQAARYAIIQHVVHLVNRDYEVHCGALPCPQTPFCTHSGHISNVQVSEGPQGQSGARRGST
jgi:hypothetical protein